MRKTLFLAAPVLTLALAGCGDNTNETPVPAATASATASAPAAPASPVTPDEARKVAGERHEGFESIGKAFKTVMDQLKASAPDVAKIQESAGTMNRFAPQVSGWFPAGSGPDVVPKSEALPAIWEKPVEFSAAAQKFVDEAGSFQRIAQSGNVAAIGAAAKALGGSCKGCHETFRKPDED